MYRNAKFFVQKAVRHILSIIFKMMSALFEMESNKLQ